MNARKNKANLDMTFVRMVQENANEVQNAKEIAKEIAERNAKAKRYSAMVQYKRENEITTKDWIMYFVEGFLMFAMLYMVYIVCCMFA